MRPRHHSSSFQKPEPVYLPIERIVAELQQVEKFKYLAVGFASDERRNKVINTWIGEANAVICTFHVHKTGDFKQRWAVTFHIGLFSILFYGRPNGSWVMTERVWPQVQGKAEMEFLRKVHETMIRDKVRNCEIRKLLNFEPLLFQTDRSQIRWFDHVTKIRHERLAGRELCPHPQQITQRANNDQVGWLYCNNSVGCFPSDTPKR